MAFAAICLSGQVWSAPFAEWFPGTSPKGASVRVWGEGDEYSIHYEAEDGHAVVKDLATRTYFYARQEADGALVSTGIAVGDATDADRTALAAIPLHQWDTSAVARSNRLARIEADESETGRRARWTKLKETTRKVREAKKKGLLMAPPSRPTLGTVKGLTLLIDFPIENSDKTTWSSVHPSVTKDHLDSLLNGENCTLYGNASSVRSYYLDVSNGRLDYSNAVIGPILLPQPRSYYDDARYKDGTCAGWLIGHAFDAIRNSADYSTKYLPILQSLSVSDGKVRSLNIWFAGEKAATWSYGLWAHKSSMSDTNAGKLPFQIGGANVRFDVYQITPITTSPAIGTFCHENGHMLCDFPDLYNYNEGSGFGCGYFSLMYGAISNTNPEFDDPYLRTAAGWLEPQILPHLGGRVTVRANHTDVWKFENPDNPEEYYLIENRQKTGRDAGLPAAGVLIWHCNEAGSNTYPSQLDVFPFKVHRLSHELSLEQADGLYQIEQIKSNTGETFDAWYAGNPMSDGVFAADALPCAKWDDGTDSALRLSEFSENGETMTFVVDPYDDGRPANDDFADAAQIRTLKGGEVRSSVGATKEDGEPNHAGISTATASLWWTFTARCSGSVTLDTRGSAIDTCLAVYTGSSVSSLASVASNDNAESGETFSRVTFDVTVGTTYHIAVTGKSRASGDIALNWEMNLNDAGLPDLMPYNLFVSKVKSGGTNTYASTEFTTSDPIYYSFRCINNGVASATGSCKFVLTLCDESGSVVKTTTYTKTISDLGLNYYYSYKDYTDFNGLSLSPGRYTLVCEADTAGAFKESDEINNRVECSFEVRYASTVAEPTVSPGDREFKETVEVAMSVTTSGATIRYTLDGTIPTEKSPAYTEPLVLDDDAVVKVRAFKSGMNPSETVVRRYTKIRTVETLFGGEDVAWSNQSDVPWRVEDFKTMRAGGLDGTTAYVSTLKATVKGRGTLKFAYKIVSSSYNNKAAFKMDNATLVSTSNSGTFEGEIVSEVTSETGATFTWTLTVNSPTYDYTSRGIWLYNVSWEPLCIPLAITSPATSETPVALLTDVQRTYLYDKTQDGRSDIMSEQSSTGKSSKLNGFTSTTFDGGSPVPLAWTGGKGTCTVTVRKIEGDKIVYTTTSPSNRTSVANLELDAAYEWTVTDQSGESASATFVTEATPPRLIKSGGMKVMRDLGGWTGTIGDQACTVRQNRLFRGGPPEDYETKPCKCLVDDEARAFFHGIVGLKTQVDMRNDGTYSTKTQTGDYPRFDMTNQFGVNYRNLYVYWDGPYYAGDTSDNGKNWGEILKTIVNPENHPLYFHCSAGRDRTGLIAGLSLALLGVDEASIMRDYQATCYLDGTNGTDKFHENIFTKIAKFSDATKSLAENTAAYFRSFGITEKEIEAFRKAMLIGYRTKGDGRVRPYVRATWKNGKTTYERIEE